MPSSPPPVDSALQAQIMQEHVNSQTELAFKKIIIDTINKQHAQSRTGLALRLPQPSPIAHCVCSKYSWTNEEAERYLQDGTLPRGLTTIGRTDTCVLLWLFDATAAGGKLPELDLDPIPDFEAHPALCAIVMGGGENIALILSEFLTMIPTGPKKVQFLLKDQLETDQSTNNQGLAIKDEGVRERKGELR